MIHEEAIRVLNAIRDEGGWTANAYDSLTLAIEALEKQIPKKPNDKFNVPGYVLAYGICPSCNRGVNSDMKFCSECGQAIDWEVSE